MNPKKTAGAVLAATMIVALVPLASARGGERAPKLIGYMPFASGTAGSLRMVVDQNLNLGVTIESVRQEGKTVPSLVLYDLERLSIKKVVPVPSPPVSFDYPGISTEIAVLDPVGHRVFMPPGNFGMESAGCALGPTSRMGIAVYDIQASKWSKLPVPCSDGDQFKTLGIYYHVPSGKLYAVGEKQGEFAARALVALSHRFGQTLLLRQINASDMALDWEIDLRAAGCDAVLNGSFGAFVGRYQDNVVAYCYGANQNIEGSQGYALRIPLVNNKPMARVQGGSATDRCWPLACYVRATPTLPGQLYPVLDPGSGRMLLLTFGSVNGHAVWVFDPPNDRFFGVIASGVAPRSDPNLTTYFGLNSETGRAYLLSAAGLLVADARHEPLPAGVSFPTISVRNQAGGAYIAVAPTLRRLFVPGVPGGFAVVQDYFPEPVDPPPLDPDRGTADIAEIPGKTSNSFVGSASAFGIHMLNTGGITRTIDNADPLCLLGAGKDSRGRCLAAQFLAGGNRELFLAATSTELGSQTGAAADGAGLLIPSSDSATDVDFRRLGSCGSDSLTEKGASPPSEYATVCTNTPLEDFRSGTRGPNGQGYPIPGSHCEDFVGSATEDVQRPGQSGIFSAMTASSVSCDASKRVSNSTASAAGAVPAPDNPIFSIARSWSKTSTEITADGMISKAKAVAEGVQLGDYSIGHIEMEVTTKAKGRTGTTSTSVRPIIGEVHGPNINCIVCDYDEVTKRLNEGLGLKARVSIPAASRFASPKGFQSSVSKDPRQRDSDRTMNDDDTFEVSGLEIIFYNDGRSGRSRLIIQLAGVRAESRYGIFSLPESSGDFSFSLDGPPTLEIPPLVTFPTSGGGSLIGRILKYPAKLIQDAWNLLVSRPGDFARLFVFWGLLSSPLYFLVRRRFLNRLLTSS